MTDAPIYELRRDAGGYLLSGGRLEEPLRYSSDQEPIETAKRMVGFLSQYSGAELHIYNEAGDLIDTKTYEKKAHPAGSDLGDI